MNRTATLEMSGMTLGSRTATLEMTLDSCTASPTMALDGRKRTMEELEPPTKTTTTRCYTAECFPLTMKVSMLRVPGIDDDCLGVAEIAPEYLDATLHHPVSPHYILIADRSTSMQVGQRAPNLLRGVRALVGLAPRTSPVTLIGFDDEAKVLFGPRGTTADAEARWSELAEGLAPCGGTNIRRALEMARDVADASLDNGEPVVMLLLTDGEDPAFTEADWLGKRSGADFHAVGICPEADYTLLNRLAVGAHGTVVAIDDRDISGLMGSLVGLTLEKFSHAATLCIETASKTVYGPERLHLRAGATTRVPFRFPVGTTDGLRLSLELKRVGADDRLRALTALVEPSLDWSVATDHIRVWRAAIDTTVGEQNLEAAPRAARSAILLVECLLAVMPPDADRAPIQAQLDGLRQLATDLDAARHDHERMRELAARAVSDASTARNGFSIGDARAESRAQSAMRSMSQAFA